MGHRQAVRSFLCSTFFDAYLTRHNTTQRVKRSIRGSEHSVTNEHTCSFCASPSRTGHPFSTSLIRGYLRYLPLCCHYCPIIATVLPLIYALLHFSLKHYHCFSALSLFHHTALHHTTFSCFSQCAYTSNSLFSFVHCSCAITARTHQSFSWAPS